jgi:hypothetical protein
MAPSISKYNVSFLMVAGNFKFPDPKYAKTLPAFSVPFLRIREPIVLATAPYSV